jgi:hypothetical protein
MMPFSVHDCRAQGVVSLRLLDIGVQLRQIQAVVILQTMLMKVQWLCRRVQRRRDVYSEKSWKGTQESLHLSRALQI